ncbi:restriction endonuclease subunit S [Helicobacter sp. 23-1048]
MRERERESDSAQDIDNLIDSILASIINLESRLEPLFCHTERSEVSQKDFSCHSEGALSATEESQQNPQNRDISLNAQYDNRDSSLVALAQNDIPTPKSSLQGRGLDLPLAINTPPARGLDLSFANDAPPQTLRLREVAYFDSSLADVKSTCPPSFARGESTDSPSLAEGVRGWVESLTDLLKSLPTPPKQGWERVKLGEVCSVASGGTPKREVAQFWNGNINWLKSEVCQNCYVYENQVSEKITELGLQKSSAKILKKNSVLIALVGATIGKIGYLTFESTTNQNIAGLYPLNEKNLMTKFLYFAIMGLYPKFKERAGFNMANLPFIKNLKIPLPPLREQEKIIACIESIESKISALDSTLPALERTKSQILQKYL